MQIKRVLSYRGIGSHNGPLCEDQGETAGKCVIARHKTNDWSPS
jgi:hypothetical protein